MITVDLPTAKLLRDAGWEQETEMYFDADGYVFQKSRTQKIGKNEITTSGGCTGMIAAPTASEVLRELPDWRANPYKNGYKDGYIVSVTTDGDVREEAEDTLASAASQMWIYLKTNDLL